MAIFYGQFKEDFWIASNLFLPEKGFYVDVGAGDGVLISNTKFLDEMGWSGLLIEPDPKNTASLKEWRTGIIEPVAIGNKEGTFPFYSCDEFQYLSGLNPTPQNTKGQVIDVPVYKLSTILEKHNVSKIDLLSIDTEGTEIDVLDSFDLNKYKPTIIIVEYVTQEVTNNKVELWFNNHPEYTLVLKNEANLIYSLDNKITDLNESKKLQIDHYLRCKKSSEKGEVLNTPQNEVLSYSKLSGALPVTTGTLLDIGSGLGEAYKYLKGFDYYGLEIVDEVAQRCRDLGFKNITVGFMERMPYADGMFDVVWARHVLEHSTNIDVVLKEVCRVLKPNGYLAFIVPTVKGDGEVAHLTQMSKDEWQSKISTYFNIIQSWQHPFNLNEFGGVGIKK